MNIEPIFDKLPVVAPPEAINATVKRVLNNLGALENYDMSTVIIDKDADNVGSGDAFRIKKVTNDKIVLIPEKILYGSNMDSILFIEMKWKDGIGFMDQLKAEGDIATTTLVMTPRYMKDGAVYTDDIEFSVSEIAPNEGGAVNSHVIMLAMQVGQSSSTISYTGTPIEFNVEMGYPFDPWVFLGSIGYQFKPYVTKVGDITSISAYKFNIGSIDFIDTDGKYTTATIDLGTL